MPGYRTCAKGHSWPADDAVPGVARCPKCGAPPVFLADSPPTLSLRARRDPPSSPPSPSGVTFPLAAPTVYSIPQPEIPGYQVLEEVGRGGMGVVFKARQISVNRIVALKTIHVGADPDLFARLKSEAEAIARLQHPNIIQVFEIGVCPSGPYLVMEYAAGGNLARHLDGAPQPPNLAARLVEILARAIYAAHEKGVVHRDLKPANVQVIEEGAFPLDQCTLKVSDFGLARRLDDTGSLTLSGQVIGTPGYMPPEQARRGGTAVGPAADIYALGVLLYESLTGRPPFHGSTPLETIHLMLSRDPLPPSRLRRQLPRDLETITLKCLHKDPARRYADAKALADDLGSFLSGRPIMARPTPVWERAVMWVRRQPGTASILASCAGAVIVSFCLLAWQWRRAELTHEKSELEKGNAERLAGAEAAARRETQALTSRLLLERGAVLCEAGDVASGLLWLARSLETAPVGDEDLRKSLRYLIGGWSGHLHLYRHHHRLPNRIEYLAFGTGDQLAIASGSTVLFTRADTGKPLDEITLPGKVIHLVGVCDCFLAAVHVADALRLVMLPSKKTLGQEIPMPARPRRAALSKECDLLLVGFDDHRARLYRIETGRQQGSDWPHAGAVRATAFRHDGKMAATGSNDGVCRLWDVPTGRLLHELREHNRPITDVTFSPDGSLVATAGEDRKAILWNTVSGAAKQRLIGHEKDVNSVAFHPTLPLLATASEEGTARMWDLASGASVGAAVRHADDVNVVAFSPTSALFATGGEDCTARVWERREPSQTLDPLRHEDAVRSLAVSPDDISVLTGGSRGGLRLWNLKTAQSRQVGYNSTVLRVAFSPDGKTFVAGQFDTCARLYDAEKLVAIGKPWKHGDAVTAVAYGPDGKLIATGCEDNDLSIRLYDPTTGEVLRSLTGHSRKVVSLAFRPNGKQIASASWDRTARIWDVATGMQVSPPLKHLDLVQAVTFSPDGTLLLSGSDDYMTRLWDVSTGKLQGPPLRHTERVQSVAFSHDGDLFATGDRAGVVGLWDTRTRRSIGVGTTHSGEVHSLAFTTDGSVLMSGGWDGVVKRLCVPAPTERGTDTLRRWLELQTGQTLLDPGVIAPLGVEAWEERARP